MAEDTSTLSTRMEEYSEGNKDVAEEVLKLTVGGDGFFGIVPIVFVCVTNKEAIRTDISI